MIHSTKTPSIMGLIPIVSINNIHHNSTQHEHLVSLPWSHYAECRIFYSYASFIMQSVCRQSVIMLNVIILNVVAPKRHSGIMVLIVILIVHNIQQNNSQPKYLVSLCWNHNVGCLFNSMVNVIMSLLSLCWMLSFWTSWCWKYIVA